MPPRLDQGQLGWLFLPSAQQSSILISITAIIITLNNSESKQVQVVNLENTVKSQEKRINDFITAINKNQKISDSQIRDLNIRLKNASKDTQVEINSLASSESAHYDSTKEAIIDAKQRDWIIWIII